jgi:hypothetical protein
MTAVDVGDSEKEDGEHRDEEGEEKEERADEGSRGGRRRAETADGTLETALDVYDVPLSISEQSSALESADKRTTPKPAQRHSARKPQNQMSASSRVTQANRQRKPLQPSYSIEDIKQEIIQSYRDCGLEPKVLFSAVKAPYDPTSITIASRWRDAKLTPQTMKRLRTRRDNLLKHWVTADNTDPVCNTETWDIDLIQKLCDSHTSHTEGPGVLSAMRQFCRQGNTTHDQMRLFDFWKWSVLVVAHQEDMRHEVGRVLLDFLRNLPAVET